MPPKKTPSAPKAGSAPKKAPASSAPKKAPASSAPKTKARPKSTAAASPAQDSPPVKIPSLNLSYEKPKASAEVARRVPELVLKSRRGWTGPPLPFDTDEAAIAWGMKDLNLGKKDLNLAKKRAAYAKSRRTIRELRGEIEAAANNEQDSMVEKAKRTFREFKPRAEGKFVSKVGMRAYVPGLTSSDESAFTMTESGSDGRHARRMGALV